MITSLPSVIFATVEYASYCSCSVGREALSINRNSVLKRPMPSPPFCNTFCASSALPMLPYTCFFTPDFVTVSFEKYSLRLSFSFRYAACLVLYSSSSSSVGSVNTFPLKPSAIIISPSEIFSTALTTDKTAGMPMARASIAL